MKRIYLKPGDIVSASMVDLVVTEKKNVTGLGYKLNYIDNNTEIKYFSDEMTDDERDYGYLIKYALDLDKNDEHYCAPYYEEK